MSRTLFFGTPEYVIPVPEALKDAGQKIVAVITQPDKPTGRKQILTPSPVKQWAESHNIKVFSPETLDEHFMKDLKPLLPIDIGILSAYGNLIPQEVLDLSPVGMLNIHPSLLPKYRGTSPVQAAIAAGDKESGATIIKMDDKHDHGPILGQITETIKPDDTTGTLRTRLFEKAAEVLVSILPRYLEGRLTPREQDHSKATFVRLVKKEYAFIPPQYLAAALEGKEGNEQWPIPFIKNYTLQPTPYNLYNFIRALDPWPLAWTLLRQGFEGQAKRLKILKAHLEEDKLVLDEVQLEGKSPVSWKQFKNGYPAAEF